MSKKPQIIDLDGYIIQDAMGRLLTALPTFTNGQTVPVVTPKAKDQVLNALNSDDRRKERGPYYAIPVKVIDGDCS